MNDDRLYRGLDVLAAHKDQLCAHLMERYRSWFGVQFEFLLYDVTSTFFEGKAEANEKAARLARPPTPARALSAPAVRGCAFGKRRLEQGAERLGSQAGGSSRRRGPGAIRLAHPPTSLVPSSSSVLCRSSARGQKEAAMLARQSDALCEEFAKIDRALGQKPQSDLAADPIAHSMGVDVRSRFNSR